MRMFLSENLIMRPVFSSKWLYFCFGFLIVGQILDGLTTKIGLDLGLAEIGTYAMPILGTHGFLGLMAWKYSIIGAMGVLYFLMYYAMKRYFPAYLNITTITLTAACLIGAIVTVQVDVSNILQIQKITMG